MNLKVKGHQIHIEIWNEEAHESLVLLHGFTGSVVTWRDFPNHLPKDLKIVAIDLMGHGLTDAPNDVSHYTMEEQIEILQEVFQQLRLSNFVLLGYSMGGRVALSYAVTYPNNLKQLILESASPGLKCEEERIARRKSDHDLAEKILKNGIHSFVEKWENIPLFASQKKLPQRVQPAVREERLAQREIGLANSLRGMGTGSQTSLWQNLQELNMPVTLITGSIDEKFCQIAKEMKEHIPDCKHYLVEEVGHAIHVENPTTFATIVKDVLNN